MRRAALLMAGLLAGGLVFLFLCSSAAAQYFPGETEKNTYHMVSPVSFPCAVENTSLTAVQLATYEGPFWEDETDEEVSGVAALVVENAGGTLISEGAVLLEQGGDILVFELYALPPGERALILEKDRKAYKGQQLLACYGWTRSEYPEDAGLVTVEESGNGSLQVSNKTNDAIPLISVRFKTYDKESGMYIGGICYTVQLADLQQGQTRVITPYRYACGYSRVVCVNVEIGE